ncbi:hypothetical protein H8356DRAFT_923782 [Neocallimastix lanati (nom. inval.)]|nr:hypothetical protein H8356DRAFT_923782 [Neocallimastix sp. JGI-2020a]
MTHDASELFVSQQEAQRLEKENATRLLNQKKLSLILDLDQTIIHATIDPTIGEWQNDPNNPNYEALKDVHHFVLPDSATIYYIKLRPGVREFLKEMNNYYELHIYTMGTRSYANAIAKIIDPTSEYFGNRILSRDESGSFALKSIQRLFPCDQSMVVVIDDRADVWCWSENLIKVQPYNFFVGIGDINNTALLIEQEKNKQIEANTENENKEKEESINKENNEVKNENGDKNGKPVSEQMITSKNTILIDNDHELEVVKNVLKNIHKTFYTSYDNKESDVSVQNIMKTMRHKVLSGKNILFSSVIPLNQDPYSTDIWNLTIMFGGTPYTKVVQELTHVVAGKNGTTKVNQARKIPGIKIVKPEWLLQSIYNWKLEDEEKYLLEPSTNDDSNSLDFLDNDDNNYQSFKNDILTEDEKMINDVMSKPLINLNELSDEWDNMDMEIDEAIDDTDDLGTDNDSLTNDSEIQSDDTNDNEHSDDHDNDDDDDDDENTNSDFKKKKIRKRKRSTSSKSDETNNSDDDDDDELDSGSDESNDIDNGDHHKKKKQHLNGENDEDNDEDKNHSENEDSEEVSQSTYTYSESDNNSGDYSEDNDEVTNELEAELEAMVEKDDDESVNLSTENGDDDDDDDDNDDNKDNNNKEDDIENNNNNDNKPVEIENESENSKSETINSDSLNNEESEGGIDTFEEISSDDFNNDEDEEIQDTDNNGDGDGDGDDDDGNN